MHCLTGRRAAEASAAAFGLPVEQVLGERRAAPLVRARWAVMLYLVGKGWSYPRIARAVGRFDHTTAMHGVRQASYLYDRDLEFRERYEAVVARLSADPPLSTPRATYEVDSGAVNGCLLSNGGAL